MRIALNFLPDTSNSFTFKPMYSFDPPPRLMR